MAAHARHHGQGQGSSREPLLTTGSDSAPASYSTMASPNATPDETPVEVPGSSEPGAHPTTAEHADIDARAARRIVRSIDRRIIPLLFFTYLLNFMDKTILSSAAVFGLEDDNHLVGAQYSWVSSVFYFGYFLWTYPTTVLIARLPVAKYLAATTFAWGAIVALTAACSSYGGLVTVRFLLGMAEATVTPALMFVTSTWYTRDEMPTRTGLWFAGNSIGGIVSSLLAYGLGHIPPSDPVGPWRSMFLLLGLLTFAWGLAVLLGLPDGIARAAFLTPAERRWAEDRVVVAGTGATARARWRRDQTAECLRDPKTWLIGAVALLSQLPNGGTQSFANLVVVSFGFTSLQSTLLNIPYSLLSAGCIALTGWLAGRFRHLNCLLAALVVLPPVAGSALISQRDAVGRGASLFGYFCLAPGPAALPLVLSLVQTNYRGVTKKMTMSALVFVAYCAGNIAGPQLFVAAEAPRYATAFRAIMVCYALVVLLAVLLRLYLQAANARRFRDEGGVAGSAGAAGAVGEGVKVVHVAEGGRSRGDRLAEAVGEVRLRPEDYEDVTDWNTFGFRYRL